MKMLAIEDDQASFLLHLATKRFDIQKQLSALGMIDGIDWEKDPRVLDLGEVLTNLDLQIAAHLQGEVRRQWDTAHRLKGTGMLTHNVETPWSSNISGPFERYRVAAHVRAKMTVLWRPDPEDDLDFIEPGPWVFQLYVEGPSLLISAKGRSKTKEEAMKTVDDAFDNIVRRFV